GGRSPARRTWRVRRRRGPLVRPTRGARRVRGAVPGSRRPTGRERAPGDGAEVGSPGRAGAAGAVRRGGAGGRERRDLPGPPPGCCLPRSVPPSGRDPEQAPVVRRSLTRGRG